MAYRPYKNLTTEKIKANLDKLRYELKNLKPSNSGQASNYYAPAIHYHKEELKLRENMTDHVEDLKMPLPPIGC